jgi:hypothetical protein
MNEHNLKDVAAGVVIGAALSGRPGERREPQVGIWGLIAFLLLTAPVWSLVLFFVCSALFGHSSSWTR